MQLYVLPLLLVLLGSGIHWNPVSGLCSLGQPRSARCSDLEDARYIDTYNLHHLSAPLASSKVLAPGNFANLTELRHLNLAGGAIETIETGSFADLHLLQSLDLSGNKIRALDDGAFDGLKRLHNLKLGDNAIRRLPAALASLKQLRLLDVSINPLDCDCATMRLRDALLARGVKISRKTQCAEPPSARHAPVTKPETDLTCSLESQDLEMQADQPEGSGETSWFEREVESITTAIAASLEEEAMTKPDVPVEEGSGTEGEKEEEDGSGAEDGFDPENMPGINYTMEVEDENEESHVSSTSTTTTEKAGILSYLGLDFFSNLNPFVSTETTTSTTPAPHTTIETSNVEEVVKSEEFLPVLTAVHVDNDVSPRIDDSASSSSPRKVEERKDASDESGLPRSALDSQEDKKGMGSYIVLASLLAILAALIAIAAYKGDFCRKKKRKRGDPERGTEMRDMHKSPLLAQPDSAQVAQVQRPKLQLSNGGTVENVPLMKSSPPSEPRQNQRSYDVNGATDGEPVKPPRKFGCEIEAPLNGLNPPMEDIDKNADDIDGPGGVEDGRELLCERPERVKIILQENPDSVPRTPMLITRLQEGENLVKAP